MKDDSQSDHEEEMSRIRDARSKTFTPGPWKAQQGAEDEPERWTVVANNGTKPYLIAVIENGQPGDTMDTEGNTARLIAAAPDLLSALKDLLSEYDDQKGQWGKEYLWEKHEDEDTIERARAIITKAEGGQP